MLMHFTNDFNVLDTDSSIMTFFGETHVSGPSRVVIQAVGMFVDPRGDRPLVVEGRKERLDSTAD